MTDAEKVAQYAQIQKAFPQNAFKQYDWNTTLTTHFPSIQFLSTSTYHLKSIMETGYETDLSGITGVAIPLKNAVKQMNYLYAKTRREQHQPVLNTKFLLYDPEPEYWYKNDPTQTRKKAFERLEDKPNNWELLYQTNDQKGKIKTHEYSQRLSDFFTDTKRLTRLNTANYRFAKKLGFTNALPPAPMITNAGASLEAAIKVNETAAKLASLYNFPVTQYYLLHISAMDSPHVQREIYKQISETQPTFAYVGTHQGQDYLFPANQYSHRKHRFEEFVENLSILARTNQTIITWYDKGNFCSSYGLYLLKKGFDAFIAPLKANYLEGGGSDGPQPGYFLNEYTYFNWKAYLEKQIVCEKDCCKNLTQKDLQDMKPHVQWKQKWKHELVTRATQLHHMTQKLNQEGNLDDFEIRLKRNKIGKD